MALREIITYYIECDGCGERSEDEFEEYLDVSKLKLWAKNKYWQMTTNDRYQIYSADEGWEVDNHGNCYCAECQEDSGSDLLDLSTLGPGAEDV